jgi:hypothetical protein
MTVFQKVIPLKVIRVRFIEEEKTKQKEAAYSVWKLEHLPSVRRGLAQGVTAELVAFSVSQDSDSHRHEHGRDNEYENSAPEALNHALPRGSGLRIAE